MQAASDILLGGYRIASFDGEAIGEGRGGGREALTRRMDEIDPFPYEAAF